MSTLGTMPRTSFMAICHWARTARMVHEAEPDRPGYYYDNGIKFLGMSVCPLELPLCGSPGWVADSDQWPVVMVGKSR